MTNEQIEELEEEEEEPRKPDCSFSIFLNKFFHHIDRGSHLRSEVLAGIVMFLVSISLLFVNMQIVGHQILGDLTVSTSPQDPASISAALTYVNIYQASLIVALLSSLAIGLIARLPFIQLSLMGLSTSILSLVGVGNGLTYYNVLFLSWISSILTGVVVGIPAIKKFVLKGLPKQLLGALPLVGGVLLIALGANLSGFFTVSAISTGNLGTTNSSFYSSIANPVSVAFICAIITFVFYFIFRAIKAKHPLSWSFLIGFGLFLVIEIIMAMISGFSTTDADSYINFGRIWLIMGSQASDKTPFGDSYLSYSAEGFSTLFSNMSLVFTKGSDFSAYEGNTVLLCIGSVLSLTLFNIVDPQIVMQASQEDLNDGSNRTFDFASKDSNNIYYINAGMNFVAPFLGLGTVTLSKTSIIGTKDKAKSGIAPLVAAIGYLVSLFILAFPALLATDVYAVSSMNEFNYFAYGNGGILYLIQGAKYGLANAMLCLIGLIMIENSIKLLAKENKKYFLVAAALFVGIPFSNLIIGLFAGLLVYALLTLFDYERGEGEKYFVALGRAIKNNWQKVGYSTYVMLGVSLLAIAL